jgi:hypothetical protein
MMQPCMKSGFDATRQATHVTISSGLPTFAVPFDIRTNIIASLRNGVCPRLTRSKLRVNDWFQSVRGQWHRPARIAQSNTTIASVKFNSATLTDSPMVNSPDPARALIPTMLTMLPLVPADAATPLGSSHIAVKFQGESICPVFRLSVRRVRPIRRTGVVHQQVEATELCDCLRNGFRGRRRLPRTSRNDMHRYISYPAETVGGLH